jgi:hypothetical protein
MYFTRRVVGIDTFLYWEYDPDDLIDYEFKMIHKSNQNFLSNIQLKSGTLEHRVTSYIPISVYFKSVASDIEAVKVLFFKLIDGIQMLDEYLLTIDRVVLEKEYIYYDVNNRNIKMIYLPLKSYSCEHQQIKIKEILLSLIYEHMNFELINEHQNMIEMLQSKSLDIFALKAYWTKDKKDLKEKTKAKWFSFVFKKKDLSVEKVTQEVSEVKANESDTETIAMPEFICPILSFEHKKIRLNQSSFLLGRSVALNDFALPHALTMGRVHAEIRKEEDAYYILDLNTKNGTYINGKRIESQKKYRLQKGDCIDMGQEKVIFE